MEQKTFFEKMDAAGLALAFGEILIKTGHSSIMPHECSLETYFSRRVPLKIPLVSAAMDTITEHKMAIALALAGGIGVIHRNLEPEQQAGEVARVKFFLNGLIKHPITVNADATVGSVMEMREQKGYNFHSFPVVSGAGLLLGLITRSEFEFCDDMSLAVKHVMTPRCAMIAPLPDTSIESAYRIMSENKKKVLLLVSDTGKLDGMYVFSDLRRILRRTGETSLHNTDGRGNLRVAAAVGIGDAELERVAALVSKHVDAVVIDTAHADSSAVFSMVRGIKDAWPDIDVVAGNISEPDSARRLVDIGVDGIKVGQGPGSICTTRVIAGIGCPQVTAIYNCAIAIEGSGVPVCADGGIRNSGDISIAIGAGAHSVMMGRLLAGTDEAPGETELYKGAPVKHYRGMGSLGAMEANRAARERYRQAEARKLVPEGMEGVVPYQGSVRNLIDQHVGGLRAGMGYVGARTIEELRTKADFHRISAAGAVESHPHDIVITRSAPNYPLHWTYFDP